MFHVSSLFLCAEKVFQEDECISLVQLFNLPSEKVRHGMILKNKITILTTEVECETEISDDEIYPIPKIFGDMHFSAFFSGIKFDSRECKSSGNLGNPILLFNTENLINK